MNSDQLIANTPAGGVLEPCSLKVFFDDYWEKSPLHIARSDTNPFAELISIDIIEQLLSTHSLRFPDVQLSHAGQAIPSSDYTENGNSIVTSRLIERYKSGSTIVISHAHQLVPNLMTLCRAIQSSLMMRCQTNVYLSPAGNQGFNPHYDTHDVLILQVSGKKTFNFYSSGADLPTSADRFNREIHEIGEKTEEIALSAGDTLYIPRGIVHDAIADTEEPSLHITLGVYPILLHTLVGEITQIALESDNRLRRAISQPAWMMEQSTETTTQLIHDVFSQHIHEKVVDKAMTRLRDEIALECVQDSNGGLAGLKSVKLQANTSIVVNHEKILQVERVAEKLTLRVFGQIAEFHEPHGSAVEWLFKRNSTQLAELPALDETQQIALAEQLLALDVISL